MEINVYDRLQMYIWGVPCGALCGAAASFIAMLPVWWVVKKIAGFNRI